MGDERAVSAGGRYRRRLWFALALVVAFLVVEVAAALLTGSLALLGDAGHLLTDVVGLGMALAAIEAAARARRHPRRTFGLYRLEVLAALGNALLLLGLAGFILFEAVQRFRAPPEVAGAPLIAVALVAIAVNLVVLALLREGSKTSLNLEGAFLEVLADLLSSVGVLIAAIVLLTTGWPYIDPIMAILIGLWVLPRALRLGGKALRVLLQAAPPHVSPDRVRQGLTALPGVVDVHELHVWTLTSGMDVASAHLDVAADRDPTEILRDAQRLLRETHGIEHATLQVESAAGETPCRELAW